MVSERHTTIWRESSVWRFWRHTESVKKCYVYSDIFRTTQKWSVVQVDATESLSRHIEVQRKVGRFHPVYSM